MDKRILPVFILILMVYTRTSFASEPELNLLLLEVRLGQDVISSAIPAYDHGSHTLLPMGELARLFSLAIQVRPTDGIASGFILNEQRDFSLNLNDARVTRAGITETFDPALVLAQVDDIYVAEPLLEMWLPVKFDIDRSRLVLQVHPLEELPLQARLNRASRAERLGTAGIQDDPDYPRIDLPYRLWSPPFIDQNLAVEYRDKDGVAETNGRYTTHLTGDLLGMESSVYFSHDTQGPTQDVRVTLGRYDPDAGLLGPLHASSYQFGSLSSTSIEYITAATTGYGVSVSNRPLTRPTQFDRQTFEGDLTPGWDVELFYNDALVGYQLPNSAGRYLFEDMPLSYGRNDFKLVFHGPLGQTRVERYSYSLAESMVQPGEFQYHLFEHRDEEGLARSIAQFDLGLSRSVSATAGVITSPPAGVEQQYATAGLRTFWQSVSLSADLIKDQNSGSLTKFGLKTGFTGITLDANRIYLDDFYSDFFRDFNDPVRTRDELRLSGGIPVGARTRIPITIEAYWEEHESGRVDTDFSARLSAYAYRTAFTNTLNWRSYDGDDYANGTLRVSRRVLDMGLRGQIDYDLGSDTKVSILALSADKFLGDGYRLTLAVAHELETPETRYSVGFTKSHGRYGLGANASYVDTGEIAVSLQFFLALGRDPMRSNWVRDARPMANTGAASARVFLDNNNNGLLDMGEDTLPSVGFTVNGGRQHARTDTAGIAHLIHLPVKQRVDVGVDIGTLEDPQWAPMVAGMNFVPRPGRVAELDFPVRVTTEIDGTIYVYKDKVPRGIGGLKLELLDDQNKIVATTTSSWDGFYILPGVVSGEYWLRVSPEQLRHLGMSDTGTRVLTVRGDGSFISGIDLLIVPRATE